MRMRLWLHMMTGMMILKAPKLKLRIGPGWWEWRSKILLGWTKKKKGVHMYDAHNPIALASLGHQGEYALKGISSNFSLPATSQFGL